MAAYEYMITKTSGSSLTYLKIIPVSSFCPQKALNIEIGSGLIREYDYEENQAAYFSGGKTIYGVLGIIHIFPISYL